MSVNKYMQGDRRARRRARTTANVCATVGSDKGVVVKALQLLKRDMTKKMSADECVEKNVGYI